MTVTAGATGCTSSGECLPGTVRVRNTCYLADPSDVVPPEITVDPPVRTREIGAVRLISNEPATIYYTADGTAPTLASSNEPDLVVIPGLQDNAVVSFFAIDVNGNQSATRTVVWQIDKIGPGSPSPFALAVEGNTRTLTWSPPADPSLKGVLIARIEGTLTASPQPGQTYAAGDMIGPGATVVGDFAADVGTFVESHTSTPGLVRYMAWAYDDILNYGSPASAYVLDKLPAPAGTIRVTVETGAVAISTQSNLVFTGASTLAGSTLTLTLDVTNATSRPLFAPKLLLRNKDETRFYDNDGTYNGYRYRALGAVFQPGATITTTLSFSSVASTEILALTLAIEHGPVLVAGHWDSDIGGSLVDPAVNQVVLTLAAGTPGQGGNASMYGGGITLDGRVIMGSRNSADLISYDLSTGKRLLGVLLLQGKAHIPRLMLDASRSTGYALVAYGHAYGSRMEGVASQLVRFDTATLAETGRIDIGTSRNRDLAISGNGKHLAIATGTRRGAILVELDDLRVVGDLAPDVLVTGVTFRADSASLVISNRNGVDVHQLADSSRTASVPIPIGNKSFRGAFAADGRFWLGRDEDVIAIDLAGGTAEAFGFRAAVLAVFDGKVFVADEGDDNLRRLNAAGVQEASFNFGSSIYGHWVGVSPF